jgi:hypothetical protein
MEPVLPDLGLLFGLWAAKPFLSSNFEQLLRHLALAVAETEHLLYFTFLLVEALTFDQATFVCRQKFVFYFCFYLG